MNSDKNYDYIIGDVIYNIWKDSFYQIVDINYKGTSKYYNIKDLLTDKIITDEWLYSDRLIWNNGSFNGYEKEFKISTLKEAISTYRKKKIKKFLDNNLD